MPKTTSLEMSKLLREAGFRQNTSLHWYESIRLVGCKNEVKEVKEWVTSSSSLLSKEQYAAPTSDELLEELPKEINKGDVIFSLRIGMGNQFGFNPFYYARYLDDFTYIHHPMIENKLLPDALAQMWLWLHSQGLLNK